MKTDAFKKMAVVSIDTGAKLGYIEDLLFDTSPLRVAVLRGKADGQTFLIPWSEIKSVGSDAITVPTDAAARTLSADTSLATLPHSDAMRRLKVVDESGTLVGTVKELEIDPQTGVVSQVEVHAGGMLGIGGTTTTIAASEIGSIGEEVMIVAGPTHPTTP